MLKQEDRGRKSRTRCEVARDKKIFGNFRPIKEESVKKCFMHDEHEALYFKKLEGMIDIILILTRH